jgi:hypothetical protein
MTKKDLINVVQDLGIELIKKDQACTELLRYLLSDKFISGDCLDGYVNVQDIITRVLEIRSI